MIRSHLPIRKKIKEFEYEPFEKEFIIEVTEPKEGEMVAQMITYPAIIIKIQSDNISSYTVKTVGGESYEIKDKAVEVFIGLPKKDDVIANPVRVKGKISVFEGSFVVRVLDENRKIMKEVTLQTDGAPAWGPFDEEIEYSDPQTPKGSIQIGWYSAKDGEYICFESADVQFQK